MTAPRYRHGLVFGINLKVMLLTVNVTRDSGTFCGKWGSLFGVACTWLARVLQVTSVSRAENLDNGMAAGLVFPLGPALYRVLLRGLLYVGHDNHTPFLNTCALTIFSKT